MTEQERFDRCLSAVLRLEGGYSDDGRDAGGATNLGITLATLSQAWGRAATREEVRALTPGDVGPIYRRLYWDAAGCGGLAAGLDLMVFDAAVNMGPGTAVELLQAALGLPVDGAAGPRTLAAAAGASTPELIRAVGAQRERRYRGMARFAVFGAGWLRRLGAVEALALGWAAPTLSGGEAA